MMTDEDLLAALEAGTIDPARFNHREHVRATYAAVRQGGFGPAVMRIGPALQRFAASLGKADRYHETLTVGFIALVNERLAGSTAADFDSFVAENPDLLDKGLLARFYRPHVLDSPLARRVFLLPR